MCLFTCVASLTTAVIFLPLHTKGDLPSSVSVTHLVFGYMIFSYQYRFTFTSVWKASYLSTPAFLPLPVLRYFCLLAYIPAFTCFMGFLICVYGSICFIYITFNCNIISIHLRLTHRVYVYTFIVYLYYCKEEFFWYFCSWKHSCPNVVLWSDVTLYSAPKRVVV
jgi:hypothetical protein